MRLILALVALLMAAPAAVAQDGAERARDQEISQASRQIARLAEKIDEKDIADASEAEKALRDAISRLRAPLATTESEIDRAAGSLDLLGPAPKEGAPAEALAVASEREALNERLSFLRGQRTRILAGVEQAERALAQLSQRRLADRYGAVIRRGPPLFTISQWEKAGGEMRALVDASRLHIDRWAASRTSNGLLWASLGGLALAFLTSVLLFGPVRQWLRTRFTARLEAHEPTPGRRVAAAGVAMLARAVPGLVGGFLVIETARFAGFITDGGEAIAQAAWVALVAYLVVDGFASGFFKPISPAWRIANVDFAKARPAAALLLAIVFVVGAKSVLVAMAATLPEHAALQRAASGAAAIIVAALLFLLCEDRAWDRGDSPQPAPARASGARLFGRALAIFILAAAISGHIALADFVATRLYYLALVLAVAWFARAALREAAAWAERRLKSGRDGDAPAGDSAAFMFWVGAAVDIVIALLLTPALLLIAGLDFAAARDIFGKALTGFRLGDIVISFSDIFFAVIAFIGVLAATRALQGGLQRGPLSHPRLDPGVRQSFVTLFGYVGLVVAALIGVSVLGVDLSNLAIIAGALSVGVGFGLQSIINNFVSGIILLFERPIKTGDWIVTASGEGIVRRIGVRSTEIETFDRSSIIIPNSELIASTVTNWTHGGALGRIKVPVGVAYSSDPEKVRDILLACAHANPHILKHPEPFVVWQDFGASSLDFELRAFLRNIADGIHVRTELRFAIFRAFREAGIEIPFPQQDIHIRSVNGAAPESDATPGNRRQNRASAPQPDNFDGPDD